MRRLPVLLAAPLLATAAQAAPIVVTHAGRLLDSNDRPVTSTGLTGTFRVFEALNPPSVSELSEWDSGTCTFDVRDGYYAVTLGETCGTNLTTDLFAGGEPRYLEVSIGGTVLRPRMRLGTIPTAGLASDALALGGAPAADFVKRAELTATGTGSVAWERLANVPAAFADGQDAAFEGVTLATNANLAGAGTAASPLALALGNDAVKSAQVESLAWSKVTGRPAGLDDGDDGLTQIAVGTGLEGTGLAGGALGVKYGAVAGTAAQGNDPRLSDARDPKPNSAHYIQNNATATPQAGAINLSGNVSAANLFAGGTNVWDAFPFYRSSANQRLAGTATSITSWSWNTGAGVSVALQFNVSANKVWDLRSAEEKALLTAMGRTGVQHLAYDFNVYRISWTQECNWLFFQRMHTTGISTTAAFTKMESGSLNNSYYFAGATTSWKLTGQYVGSTEGGYEHPHPACTSTTGSALIAMPANVHGRVDLSKPLNWGFFNYLAYESGAN